MGRCWLNTRRLMALMMRRVAKQTLRVDTVRTQMASIMADLVPWKYFPQDATTEGCDVHKRKTTCKLNPIKN